MAFFDASIDASKCTGSVCLTDYNMNSDTVVSKTGTYALIMQSKNRRKVTIGKLGQLQVEKGFYVYIGSAFGPGGLRARIRHHLGMSLSCHWHIDYLKPYIRVLNISLTYDPVRRECSWAELLSQQPESSHPIIGFGASDCTCTSHLFFLQSKRDVNVFQDRIYESSSRRQPLFNVPPELFSNQNTAWLSLTHPW